MFLIDFQLSIVPQCCCYFLVHTNVLLKLFFCRLNFWKFWDDFLGKIAVKWYEKVKNSLDWQKINAILDILIEDVFHEKKMNGQFENKNNKKNVDKKQKIKNDFDGNGGYKTLD